MLNAEPIEKKKNGSSIRASSPSREANPRSMYTPYLSGVNEGEKHIRSYYTMLSASIRLCARGGFFWGDRVGIYRDGVGG